MDVFRKSNCYTVNITRFYTDMEAIPVLVFESSTNKALRDFELVIGKRRKYQLQCPLEGNVYMLVRKDGAIIAYDKMELSVDADTQIPKIDVEGYLLSKNYAFSQVDYKSYSKELNKKKSEYFKEYHGREINQYGMFYARYYWIGVDSFYVMVDFFPNACKLGEEDVVTVNCYHSDESLIDTFAKLTLEKQDWDFEVFGFYFAILARNSEGTIKTTSGELSFGRMKSKAALLGGITDLDKVLDSMEEPEMVSLVEIKRTFTDGEYKIVIPRPQDEDAQERLCTFAFSILKAKSLEQCRNIECKATMLGIIAALAL